MENIFEKPSAQMIVTDGGMGDLVAILVAVQHNILSDSRVSWRVYLPDYLHEFACHVLSKEAYVIPFSKAKELFIHGIPTWTTEWKDRCHTPMRTHPTDYGFHLLVDRHIRDMSQKNYLKIRPSEIDVTRFNLPKRYVCIQAAGSEPVKTLPAYVLNSISHYLRQRDYTPVFLGKKESATGVFGLSVKGYESGVDYGLGINLMDQTSLLESAAILDGAKAFVGMDGGLMHLAGTTSTEIVCGFTLVEPYQVAPYRRGSQKWRFHPIEPDKQTHNRYYQSTVPVMSGGDHRKFPGWEKVLSDLTADKFISQLKQVV